MLQKPEVTALDLAKEATRVDIINPSLPLKGVKIAEHLVRFPEKVSRTAAALMPNYLCEYLYELASMVRSCFFLPHSIILSLLFLQFSAFQANFCDILLWKTLCGIDKVDI